MIFPYLAHRSMEEARLLPLVLCPWAVGDAVADHVRGDAAVAATRAAAGGAEVATLPSARGRAL